MSQPDIVKKLAKLVEEGIDSEAKVVYLLAETRKLIETYPPTPPPVSLKLYCHWALHVDLTSPGTTLGLLQKIDEFVDSVYGSGKRDDGAEQRMLDELRVLSTFKSELRAFFLGYGIPTTFCDDSERWRTFLAHYAGVIEDGSLSCSAKGKKLNYVDEVVFRKGTAIAWPNGVEAFLPFELRWTIKLLDGRTIDVETSARISPSGEFLPDSSINLN